MISAACMLQVYIFGGMTIDGHLLNDLWALDLDNMQWSHCLTYGYTPSPRKGEHHDIHSLHACWTSCWNIEQQWLNGLR